MDIFNLKKVEELEQQVKKLEQKLTQANAKNLELQMELSNANSTIDQMSAYVDSTPKDCVRGEWCAACEFGKSFYYNLYYQFDSYQTINRTVCGKGKSCHNFVQKEVE